MVTAALAAVLGGACAWQYGPPRDDTRFKSARENETGAVLYTVQELVYRPAAGLAAFPDGGIPWYVTDRNVIGLLDAGSTSPRSLETFDNRHWQHGQGQLTVHSFIGHTAIVIESGQRRDNYETEVRYYLLDTGRGRLTALALEKELAERGRGVGYFYLLDGHGMLLFVTPPRGAKGRVETPENQIWLRTSSGEYRPVASGADLYVTSAPRLVYFEYATRRLAAYDVATGMTQTIARYSPDERSPDRDVRISADGKALESWGRDADGVWQRRRAVLTLDAAR